MVCLCSSKIRQLLKFCYYPGQYKYTESQKGFRKGDYPEPSCNMLINWLKSVDVIQPNRNQNNLKKKKNTTEKLLTEIRQTSSHKPARENAQGFPLHFAIRRFVSPRPRCCFSFLALIAVYREKVITCETGRVIFLPRV